MTKKLNQKRKNILRTFFWIFSESLKRLVVRSWFRNELEFYGHLADFDSPHYSGSQGCWKCFQNEVDTFSKIWHFIAFLAAQTVSNRLETIGNGFPMKFPIEIVPQLFL